MTQHTDINSLIVSLKGRAEGFGAVTADIEARIGFIDDELMKRGTLASASMDLAAIETNSRDILTTCTHLAAFRGLALALPLNDGDRGLEDALSLTTALFAEHWPDLHPTGVKAARRREAWARDIIGALEQSVERTLQQQGQLSEAGRTALAGLIAAADRAGIETGRLAKLASRPVLVPGTDAGLDTAETGAEIIRLDARGRAELRRDIRALADRINRFAPDAAVGYHLRGYAAWLEYADLPAADEAGVTSVQAMPAAIRDEHQKAAQRPSPAALARLEDRLFLSPDWFEGQKLASEMAARLGLGAVAEAIRDRTRERLTSQSGLKSLKYTNGQPFVTVEMGNWLHRTAESPDAAGENLDLVGRLGHLNERLAAARTPRARATLKLELAIALRDGGLERQAEMLADELHDKMRAEGVAEWDGELFAQVAALRGDKRS